MREMRESGVDFAENLPSDWQVTRGKNVLRLLQRPVREDDGIITCFRDGEVTLRANRRTEGFTIATKEFGYQGIEPGDLVVHGMDGFAGSIGISDSRGKASPVLNVLDSDQNKRFLMYYLRGLAYREVFLALADGIRVRSCNLSWKKLGNLPILLPPLDEQRHIADYLDAKCAEIDRAVTSAEASIEELGVYRTTLVSNVTLGGSLCESEMKQSGLAWIPSIPDGWHVMRVGLLLREPGDRSVTGAEEPLSMSQKTGVTPTRLMDTVPNEASTRVGGKLVRQGDLVFNKLKAHLGVFAESGYDGVVSPDYAVYRATELASAKYLEYLFHTPACIDQFKLRITGVAEGLRRLYTSGLFAIRVPMPNLAEQRKAVAYLDAKCAAIANAIAAKQAIIDDLKAYKQSLIYEVVTGKREV